MQPGRRRSLCLNQVRITEPEGGRTPYKTGTISALVSHGDRREILGAVPRRGRTDAPRPDDFEYGFVGPDKLGRVYNQAARPHIRPHSTRTGRLAGGLSSGDGRDIYGGGARCSIESILRAILVADPDVAAIIGSRAYQGRLPREPTFPAIVYQHDQPPPGRLDGYRPGPDAV